MSAADLYAHLAGGVSTTCRAWGLTRRDGLRFGFTDHDRMLRFDGMEFRADSGLTARALQQTTGLAVDNSEAVGALSDAVVTEADLLAGRYDGAEVVAWLVNWADVAQRVMQFRGTLGEVVRSGGAFRAELRGLTEALNQPQGRVFQRACSAVLGDARCRFDRTAPGYSVELAAGQVVDRRQFAFASLPGFDDRWFERGRLLVLSGAAAGMVGLVKIDRQVGTGREIELWQSLGAEVGPDDLVRIEAGCDKQPGTCRAKFGNFLNFRGFPHLPGDDWLSAYPSSSRPRTGGSLFGGGT
ncbi:MAG: DUF2163 domain-containing protein [Pseudomonadota bacterium]